MERFRNPKKPTECHWKVEAELCDWVNHMSITYKQTNQIPCYLFNRGAVAQGRYLVRILATFHRHMANRYAPLCLTELFPQAARSEAKTCCLLIQAFRAFFLSLF